jgi:hypothetical protein
MPSSRDLLTGCEDGVGRVWHAGSGNMAQQQEAQQESNPLPQHLGPSVCGPTMQPDPLVPRWWRGPWWAVGGRGEATDAAAGCLASQAPCVQWGWKQERSAPPTGVLPPWRAAARYVAVALSLALLAHFGPLLVGAALCPKRGHASHKFGAPSDGPSGGEHRGLFPDSCPEPSAAIAMVLLLIAAIAAATCAALFFVRRRTQLRERRGMCIPGDEREDCAKTALPHVPLKEMV